MDLLSTACLLTGFVQAGVQCWEDIWLSIRIQRGGIRGCPVFSPLLLLGGAKQNNSWLFQSWCRG